MTPPPESPATTVSKPTYNGIALQKARILARLADRPATCEQLQTECQSPDPRARIHELRTSGHEITTHFLHRINNDASVNKVGLYVLRVKNDRQAGLFEPS